MNDKGYVIRNTEKCRKKDIEILDMFGKETIFNSYEEADKFRMSLPFNIFKRCKVYNLNELLNKLK
ncbi:MAG: hypothetical protein BV457_00015 [Thermoplasmata archaeon M9B1D]|nr:MAG: hypothetical protein BV457_00015 [Thermoplasmata archaeon M9B1D]PNX52251.1 MAG: hypothetical protein BV456_00280 [Thermoplasmata archaeon M8B2D]